MLPAEGCCAVVVVRCPVVGVSSSLEEPEYEKSGEDSSLGEVTWEATVRVAVVVVRVVDVVVCGWDDVSSCSDSDVSESYPTEGQGYAGLVGDGR